MKSRRFRILVLLFSFSILLINFPLVFNGLNFESMEDNNLPTNNIPDPKPKSANGLINYVMTTDYPYNWIDASGGSQPILSDDGYSTEVLPFNFNFYNVTYTTVYVSANGYLSFVDSTPSTWSNVAFPTSTSSFRFMIAPFWDDVDVGNGGQIFVQSFGTYWVAEWLNVFHNDNTPIGSFEVILYNTGEMVFNYDYFTDTSTGYTCGLNYGVDTFYYNSYQGISTATDDFSIHFATEGNFFAPNLTLGSVSPMTGNQTTPLTFNVTYTDLDNDSPEYVNVLINESSYPMLKKNKFDDNYTDGCVYEFITYLQPGNYTYSFECSDEEFMNSTITYTGIEITEAPNLNAPTLLNGKVTPDKGFIDETIFVFSIIYTDLENNAPIYITITIGSDSYNMGRQNRYDNNYMDGCLYVYRAALSEVGEYSFKIQCSDVNYTASAGPYTGPIVEVNPIGMILTISLIIGIGSAVGIGALAWRTYVRKKER
jgi:hypothetical protein